MNQITQQLPEIKLVGISVRTSTAEEFNPETAKIGLTIQKYISENISSRVNNKKNNDVLYCVYTDYESDVNGKYTYFIGEEVTAFTEGDDLEHRTIDAQNYAKFTSEKGAMPEVCINLWQKIWQLTPEQLGGERRYHADFELYDLRSHDPKAAELDIYIGLK